MLMHSSCILCIDELIAFVNCTCFLSGGVCARTAEQLIVENMVMQVIEVWFPWLNASAHLKTAHLTL